MAQPSADHSRSLRLLSELNSPRKRSPRKQRVRRPSSAPPRRPYRATEQSLWLEQGVLWVPGMTQLPQQRRRRRRRRKRSARPETPPSEAPSAPESDSGGDADDGFSIWAPASMSEDAERRMGYLERRKRETLLRGADLSGATEEERAASWKAVKKENAAAKVNRFGEVLSDGETVAERKRRQRVILVYGKFGPLEDDSGSDDEEDEYGDRLLKIVTGKMEAERQAKARRVVKLRGAVIPPPGAEDGPPASPRPPSPEPLDLSGPKLLPVYAPDLDPAAEAVQPPHVGVQSREVMSVILIQRVARGYMARRLLAKSVASTAVHETPVSSWWYGQILLAHREIAEQRDIQLAAKRSLGAAITAMRRKMALVKMVRAFSAFDRRRAREWHALQLKRLRDQRAVIRVQRTFRGLVGRRRSGVAQEMARLAARRREAEAALEAAAEAVRAADVAKIEAVEAEERLMADEVQLERELENLKNGVVEGAAASLMTGENAEYNRRALKRALERKLAQLREKILDARRSHKHLETARRDARDAKFRRQAELEDVAQRIGDQRRRLSVASKLPFSPRSMAAPPSPSPSQSQDDGGLPPVLEVKRDRARDRLVRLEKLNDPTEAAFVSQLPFHLRNKRPSVREAMLLGERLAWEEQQDQKKRQPTAPILVDGVQPSREARGAFRAAADPLAQINEREARLLAMDDEDVLAMFRAARFTSRRPRITDMPPAEISVVAESRVALSVTATGRLPLRFEWRWNATPLPPTARVEVTPDGTSSTVVWDEFPAIDEGAYDCVVSNAYGSLASLPTTLLLAEPPHINVHPLSVTVKAGESVCLLVRAVGSPPLRFNWTHNGTAFRTNLPEIVLVAVTQANAGRWACTVSNKAGTVRSVNAIVTVLPPDKSAEAQRMRDLPPPTITPGAYPGGKLPRVDMRAC